MPKPSYENEAHTITCLPPEALIPSPNNARTHSERQLQQIANSIQQFGFLNPVLVDEGNMIIAGHGRVTAAKLLGLKTVPTMQFRHLTETQKRAYILADNKLAEKAGWDKDILAIELQNLLVIDDSFDVSITGFEMPEIDLLLIGDAPVENDPDGVVPNLEDTAITQPGDLWQLGQHMLYCGNALLSESYQTLLGTQKAHIVFTDPPYNVPINGHVCGTGKIKHREFAMANGEMSEDEFTTFLEKSFKQLAAYSHSGSIHYICMDWRHMAQIIAAGNKSYTELKNLCVWNKNNGGMGTLYRSKHELVFVFKNGKAPHTNNVELGKHGRYRTNVWNYPNGTRANLEMHPTVKPVSLIADALLDCSKRNNIVLDPFGGSGSTLIAAERVGRKAYLMELDPLYVDTIIRRWKNITSQQAVHQATGKTFEQLEAEALHEQP